MDVTSDKLMKDLKAVVNDAEDLIKITAGQGGEQIARIRTRFTSLPRPAARINKSPSTSARD